jgi:acetate kinase
LLGIGENSPAIRAEACAGLEAFGIEIDPLRNEATVGSEGAIHRGRTPSMSSRPTRSC